MKNKQALYLLIAANTVSGIAQGISMLAIPWYFTSVLNDAGLFGKIYAFATFLSIPWNLYAGTLIDRYSRKKIFIWLNLVSGMVLFFASIYGYANGHMPLILVACVFTTMILNFNIHYPALYAFGQEISNPSDYGKMSSILEVLHQSTTIISGALAAMLLSGVSSTGINIMGLKLYLPFEIRPWTLWEIFLLDGLTYLIALTLILLIKYSPVSGRNIQTGKITDRIKTGFRFLKRNPLIFLFGVFSYNVFVVIVVEVHLLLPMYIDKHLGLQADVLASSEIYYALGALFSGIAIRKIFKRTSLVFALLTLMFINAVVFIIAGLTRDFLIFYLISVLLGVSNAGIRVLRVTFLFKLIPNAIIGRCSSVFAIINIGMRFILITLFSFAFFTTGNNVVYAYIVCGTLVLLSMLPILLKYLKLVSLSPTETVTLPEPNQ